MDPMSRADRPLWSQRFGKITEAKLEHWYGKDCVEQLMYASNGLKWPVPVMGLPIDLCEGMILPRISGGMGFASLGDLISEATTGGKIQQLPYNKTTTVVAPAVASSCTMWPYGAIPVAGAAPAAPAGGTVPTRADTGALGQQNAIGGDTLHVTTWMGLTGQVGTLMLYDYLFGCTTAANPGTGAVSVTGAQTRYTGAVNTDSYAGGNFISNWITVVLAATAHNITYTYTDQDGNVSASSGAMTGRSAGAALTCDLTAPAWCANFAAGDTGVKQLTAVTFSASPLTGQVAHYIGHPLAFLPQPVINVGFVLDGINSAFNLIRVQDGACLALMEFFKSATAVSTWSGNIQLVSG